MNAVVRCIEANLFALVSSLNVGGELSMTTPDMSGFSHGSVIGHVSPLVE